MPAREDKIPARDQAIRRLGSEMQSDSMTTNAREMADSLPHDADRSAGAGSGGHRVRMALPAFISWCIIAAGLTSAIVVLARTHWYPQLDLAMTELRVRDVASAHPPLLGLIGRIGTQANQGSHPGPLSFYMLWPFYELFGGSAWALEAATACFHALAAGVAISLAQRRGGSSMALAVATVIACLLAFFGPFLVMQPWNPYLPLLWWIAFLLAAWSAMCGDFPTLPVAVIAGTVCAQTHISYALPVGGVAVLIVGRVWALSRRSSKDAATRRRLFIWSGVAVAVLVVLWLPPILQQLGSGSNGNLGIIFRYFSSPPEAPVGISTGVRLVLVRLNPWNLVRRDNLGILNGSVLPGLTLLGLWCASAVAAIRRTERRLVLLDAVLAVAVICCTLAASRIFGFIFFYLVLWAWPLCAMMIFATAWCFYALIRQRLVHLGALRIRAVSNATLAVVLVAFGARFFDETRDVSVTPSTQQSEQLGTLARSTLNFLRSDGALGGGERGSYLISFDDPYQLGAQAFGLLDELERAGFHVGMAKAFRVYVQPHRVLPASRATGEVLLVVGPTVNTWQSRPNVRRVAYVDPRTPAQRYLFNQLSNQAEAQLRSEGRGELIPQITGNLFSLATNLTLPARTRGILSNMLHLDQETAVFVGPVDAFAPAAQ